MRRYDHILLDADNTLFDFDWAEHEALKRAVTERGCPFTAEVEALYLTVNRALWADFDRGIGTQAGLTVERFRRFNEALGLDNDPAVFNRDYLTYLGQCALLLPGAEELCKTLREAGCVLSIATNGVARVQHARLEASPLRPYISHLFISEELGAQKPLPGFFEPMLTALAVTDRSRCLMVGDNLNSDVQGGLTAGLPTAWYNPHGAPLPHDIRPTFVVADYNDLKDLILE